MKPMLITGAGAVFAAGMSAGCHRDVSLLLLSSPLKHLLTRPPLDVIMNDLTLSNYSQGNQQLYAFLFKCTVIEEVIRYEKQECEATGGSYCWYIVVFCKLTVSNKLRR